MSKTYFYPEEKVVEFPGNTKIEITVEYGSAGNTGVTNVSSPIKKQQLQIKDNATEYFGLARNLIGSPITIGSEVSNPVDKTKKIEVTFKVNGETLLKHSNLKSEAEKIFILFNFSIVEPTEIV